MFTGSTIFSQLMLHVPRYTFDKCVDRYKGNYKVQSFSCIQQFYCMAFAQLTYRESLRDIETCLRAIGPKSYHLGFARTIARSTLADANENRSWRIYADFAQALISIARKLYQDEPLIVDLDETIYALDSTTIDLCLSLFPWAKFRSTKSAIKMHTLLDLRGPIPSFIEITDGKIHDVNILDTIMFEPGSFYVMDRGYLDYERLFNVHKANAFFVTRSKSNSQLHRRYSAKISDEEWKKGVRSDNTVYLTTPATKASYPEPLRRIKYIDIEKMKRFTFITNNWTISALTCAQIYKCRWAVELFFKWIKQHLRIKAFYGTSENAVKTQIWIAVSTYVLIAIVRKRLGIETSLYNILQILSLTLFEKSLLNRVYFEKNHHLEQLETSNQLNLFEL